ncbi:MAG TPA: glycosyltransferase [Gallionellaceae bacterium]|nr:glycosyltransferase [Gallionellaceae bacterium]
MNVTKRALVSVVIPTYNHAHFLGRALQSVLDQTYTNWEAIVIDNHSQDNTDDVVERFADPRISLLKIHNNGVIAASRNRGILAAKGEWVAFLDSDDWWVPCKLLECLKEQNNGVDFFYHDLRIVREKPSIFKASVVKSRQLSKPVLIDLLAGGNVIANSSVVVRKNLLTQIGGLDEDRQMIGCEDYNLWLRVAQKSDAFLYIPKTLGYYLLHGNGVSRKDMSIPMRCATEDFIRLLDYRQTYKHESRISYAKARSLFLAGDYRGVKRALTFCMLNGTWNIKLRACYMLIVVLIGVRKFEANKK